MKPILDELDVDRLKALLRHRIAGIEIDWVDEITSTNDELVNRARDGARAWTVLGANWQTGGRGRHRRRWASPAGGLYMSVLLRLEKDSSPVTLIPLVVGLALKDAIEREAKQRGGEVSIHLKWPNDILSESGKLAGILCESMENDNEWTVIAGIGMNMVPLSEEAKRLILSPATSLHEEAELDWTRAGMVTAFMLKLAERVEDWRTRPEHVIRQWLEGSGSLDKMVRVKAPSGDIEGKVKGLSSNGGLLLLSNGITKEITSAEAIEEIHD